MYPALASHTISNALVGPCSGLAVSAHTVTGVSIGDGSQQTIWHNASLLHTAQVLSRHSLSRGALLADGAPPIFLLDAYVLLVVMYTARSPPSLPFPPPQTSALRKTLAALRQERRITPQVWRSIL